MSATGIAEYIRRLEACLATGEGNLTAHEFSQWAPQIRMAIKRAKEELEAVSAEPREEPSE